ncbi:MAG TPA: hypothetical protein VFU04_02255, partial [Solirubrobacterales bacterium]|nr:hypothetical protein [Solirubrobacterales bacterium]
ARAKPAPPRGEIGPTPALGACCRGGRERCDPDPALWEAPLWRELGFSLDHAHAYAYSYASDGERFTVRAQGDLDCDGVYSTFELESGAGAPTVTDELE